MISPSRRGTRTSQTCWQSARRNRNRTTGVPSVVSHQNLQGSLGYFILRLVSVLFGVLFFGERLRRLQGIALALATIGVVVLIVQLGTFPWISLTLAFSFCFYGVARKGTPIEPLVCLSVETLMLAPIALGFVLFRADAGTLVFGQTSRGLAWLVVLSGVVTTVPLICFGEAVQRLHLITIGFLQYISPTIAFLIAVFYFGEPFTPAHQISFSCIWIAICIFVVDAVRRVRSAKSS